MTDVLGPCPDCGYAGTHVTVGTAARRTVCGRAACTFMCTTAHWNSMRRKMTREEAKSMEDGVDALVSSAIDFGASTPMNADPLRMAGDALKSRLRAALTGEKT